jgi:hypothetical protein
MTQERQEIEEVDLNEWFRSSDETRTGFIDGSNFFKKPVEYSVIEGMGIFEGDIALGHAAEMDSAETMNLDEISVSGLAHGVVVVGEKYRWPNGEIPFEIDPAMTNQQLVRDAIDHWEQNTRMRFPERTAANSHRYRNWVRFFNGSGCWSYVGMRGSNPDGSGMQQISLGTGCGLGAAIHEIGHAAGLWHEQSREDRDRFIRILWANVTPGMEHNFNQHITDGDDVGNYDFDSIMHYGRFAFSRNGQPTIECIGGQAIGQRSGLSQGDIAAIRFMYPQLEPSQSWSGVQFRGSVPAGATRRWFTHSWPSYWYVVWTVIPTSPVQNRSPQLEWKVMLERQTETHLKYYIEVKNLSARELTFEARYQVLGWNRAGR